MIRPGEEWGSPSATPPDLDVTGSDAALARAVAGAPGALVRFHPDATSDLARAVGLGSGDVQGTALSLDVLALADGTVACNMLIVGTPPDRLRRSSPSFDFEVLLESGSWFTGRATTAVVAIGQFLRGRDLVPRGHPGDGRAEIQVYDLRRQERRLMRARLATGGHVPHPRIHQRAAVLIRLRAHPAAPCEVDGAPRAPATDLDIGVRPGAYRLLV
jgi:putative lipid kinase YegS-like protein